jgi:hypothetical protein
MWQTHLAAAISIPTVMLPAAADWLWGPRTAFHPGTRASNCWAMAMAKGWRPALAGC